jgi:hypothetical protein
MRVRLRAREAGHSARQRALPLRSNAGPCEGTRPTAPPLTAPQRNRRRQQNLNRTGTSVHPVHPVHPGRGRGRAVGSWTATSGRLHTEVRDCRTILENLPRGPIFRVPFRESQYPCLRGSRGRSEELLVRARHGPERCLYRTTPLSAIDNRGPAPLLSERYRQTMTNEDLQLKVVEAQERLEHLRGFL